MASTLNPMLLQLLQGMRQTSQTGGGTQPSLLSQGAVSGGQATGYPGVQSPPSLNTPDQSGQQSYLQQLLARTLPGGGMGQNSQSNAAPGYSSPAPQSGGGNNILQMILHTIASQSGGPTGAQPASSSQQSPSSIQALLQQMSQQHSAMNGPPTMGGGSTPTAAAASQFPWWLNMNRPTT